MTLLFARFLFIFRMLAFIRVILRIISRVKRAVSSVLLVLLATFIVGVVGFHHFENLDWLDAFYFTFVTVATIGFGDITPHTIEGKILVVIIASVGIASFAIVATSIVQSMFEESMQQMFGLVKMYLKNHVIICGWNETTKAAVEELLTTTRKKIVIVDGKIDKCPIEHPRVSFIHGNCWEPAILEKAGVKTASHAIVATGTDSETILTTLQLKALNKNIHIAAEAREASSHNLIKQAGADQVIGSLSFGGRLLASSITSPGSAFLMEDLSSTGAGNDLYEIETPRKLIGKTFKEAIIHLKTKANILPIAIRRENNVIINPKLDQKLMKGDHLIIICTPNELRKIK